MDKELEKLRADIDSIDAELQRLLNERAACAQRVAEVKTQAAAGGDEGEPVFYRPEREAQVLRKVMQRNSGPLEAKTVAHIFREIMSACLALEKPISVAYLGPQGTFTEAAALKHFGNAALREPKNNISDIFAAVQRRECQYGVLPVENSTEGMVTHTIDNFIASPLKICGELELPIALHLLVQPDADPAQLEKICAHQQALAQSRNWLQQHFPGVEIEAVSSNGEAARIAASNAQVAAVAGEMAAERYGLVHVASDIQDYADNTTRFLVIANQEVPASGHDKTSLVVSTRNEPGALYHLLASLKREGISLTRIETRPSRTENWAYVFFMEFHGHHQEASVQRVIDDFVKRAIMVKVLGSYPAAVI
ncbi:MAG: prephenate dehydratase [Gammaproteobacteria bacterium]|nr:prephenate dehydratase [Gammaproteobacteria bacterium]NND40128.1 prephenate dehydratase [Pseudomonadales bacterium]NNL10623.1 prephenate dehydratase [Pseudomonadales bacterium]NNM12574.1 prephenate dehydratase [Pseudomonadales bacterium]RZV57312.1 MAG: prephenate dehydratase [Pseudomonadales bacterium]